MRLIMLALPALLLAGAGAAQESARPDPREARAKVPPVEFRSALEGYRPYADAQPRDWRSANEEVGAGGGHAGHVRGQGPGRPAAKPQPGSPERSGGHEGHHK